MYTVTRRGSVADAVRQMRDIPARVIPYAASTALTRTAQAAVPQLQAEMQRVFDRPVAYTLNALRVVPSTVQTLTARVAVKDQAGGSGTRPESYLLPEVEGGGRGDKRSERALRYRGVLRPGEQVVPARGAPLDAAGNLSGATVRGILRRLQDAGAGKKGAARQGYFAGAAGRKQTRGIWLREGRSLTPVLLFVRPARYRPRLNFERIAERVARDVFPREFRAAADALVSRSR